MFRLIIRVVLAVVLSRLGSAVVLAADPPTFSSVGMSRSFASVPDVHEYLFDARRGRSSFDPIALHRVTQSITRSANQPVVLYLPGTWMNGTVAPDDPRYSLALFLAAHGIDCWTLDYRTHFIPPEAAQSDLGELKSWTNELFESDIETASQFVIATTGRRRIVVAGFSRGVSFAYQYAADHPQTVARLLLFDGYIGHGETGAVASGTYAEDVAGKHLTWDNRAALLRLVIANPHAPAPIAKYKDAADNLNHVVYDSAGFGGKGGLANPFGGFSDPSILARVLITYDRYWPITQDYEDSFTPVKMAALQRSQIPVLAFSSTNIAPDWSDRVARSAAVTDSPKTRVIKLDGWGHLDVICGRQAEREVFAPALEWIKQPRE